MIFEADDFNETKLSRDLLGHIAKIANNFILENGFLVYGFSSVDEKDKHILENFSSTKDQGDLDTGFVIGMTRMGRKKPIGRKSSYKVQPTEREEQTAKDNFHKQVMKENARLRALQSKGDVAKPLGEQ